MDNLPGRFLHLIGCFLLPQSVNTNYVHGLNSPSDISVGQNTSPYHQVNLFSLSYNTKSKGQTLWECHQILKLNQLKLNQLTRQLTN